MPPGEHASVSVCPSLPFSEVPFASQVVGVPSLAADGGTGDEDGPVFELSVAVFVWLPVLAVLFSFFSFEQPTLPSAIAASKSTTQPRTIRRSSRNSDSRRCGSGVDWYVGVTYEFDEIEFDDFFI